MKHKSGEVRKLFEIDARIISDNCLVLKTKQRPNAWLNGRYTSASRAVWILANGDPGELWVLHTCDNAWCIRLNHLYLGTIQQNIKDRDDRKRTFNHELRSHCRKGHEVFKKGPCPKCHRIVQKAYEKRKKEKEKMCQLRNPMDLFGPSK